jgi:hypothetical protein
VEGRPRRRRYSQTAEAAGFCTAATGSHETGKRQRFERPESEWVRQQEEAWRIVPDELWQAAQETRGRPNERHLRDTKGRIRRSALGTGGARRKRLLAGFLECGECGGSYHVVSRDNSGCSWNRNRGPAARANDAKIPQAILERALLHAVREALDEEVAAHALEVALEELRRRIAAAEPRRLEEELAGLDAKIERALDLAIELGDLGAAKEKQVGRHEGLVAREQRDRRSGVRRLHVPPQRHTGVDDDAQRSRSSRTSASRSTAMGLLASARIAAAVRTTSCRVGCAASLRSSRSSCSRERPHAAARALSASTVAGSRLRMST